MKELIKVGLFALVGAMALLAQGPPPGGPGMPGGHGMQGGPGMSFGGLMHGAPVTGSPFSATATTQTHQTLSDGNQISEETHTKMYRDSSGRIRTETQFTTPAGSTETRVSIFDPVAGFAAMLNPAKLTAMKHSLPAPGSMPAHGPRGDESAPPPDLQKTDLGTKTIAGLEATGTRSTMTIPAGAMGNTEAIQVIHETWTSSALHIPVLVTSSDPRRGAMTMQLSEITQKEPDASLFEIPSNYKVTAETGGPHGPHPPPPAE